MKKIREYNRNHILWFTLGVVVVLGVVVGILAVRFLSSSGEILSVEQNFGISLPRAQAQKVLFSSRGGIQNDGTIITQLQYRPDDIQNLLKSFAWIDKAAFLKTLQEAQLKQLQPIPGSSSDSLPLEDPFTLMLENIPDPAIRSQILNSTTYLYREVGPGPNTLIMVLNTQTDTLYVFEVYL